MFKPHTWLREAGRGNKLSRHSTITRKHTWIHAGQQGGMASISKGYGRCRPSMLHPGHKHRFLWDLFGMLMLCYDVVIIPVQAAFDPHTATHDHIINWIVLLFWTGDLFLSCITGYYVQGSLVLQPRAVLLHYARTWMIPDIAIIGLDWATVVMNLQSASQSRDNTSNILKTLKIIRMIRMLRLVRLLKLRRILQDFHEHSNSESFSIILSLCTLVVFLVAVNHFIACLWYAVGTSQQGISWVLVHDLQDREVLDRYLTSLHWALTNIASSMEVHPYNTTERAFAVIVLIIGVILSSAFLSMVTGSMLQLWTLWNEERRQFWLLRRYLRDANISSSLAMRVECYLEFIWRREQRDVQEQQVQLLSRLSDPLQNELKHESFAPHLRSHALFSALCDSTKVFLKACAACALAPGDLHFCCGEEAASMTFITNGTLQYHRGSDTGSEHEDLNSGDGVVTHMQEAFEGEWVSEAALWVPWTHVGDITAETVCQLIAIDAKVFGEGVSCNAHVGPVVYKYARRFIDKLNEVSQEELSDLLERTFQAEETYGVSKFASFLPTSSSSVGRSPSRPVGQHSSKTGWSPVVLADNPAEGANVE